MGNRFEFLKEALEKLEDTLSNRGGKCFLYL